MKKLVLSIGWIWDSGALFLAFSSWFVSCSGARGIWILLSSVWTWAPAQIWASLPRSPVDLWLLSVSWFLAYGPIPRFISSRVDFSPARQGVPRARFLYPRSSLVPAPCSVLASFSCLARRGCQRFPSQYTWFFDFTRAWPTSSVSVSKARPGFPRFGFSLRELSKLVRFFFFHTWTSLL
jgi:hypothetical protein